MQDSCWGRTETGEVTLQLLALSVSWNYRHLSSFKLNGLYLQSYEGLYTQSPPPSHRLNLEYRWLSRLSINTEVIGCTNTVLKGEAQAGAVFSYTEYVTEQAPSYIRARSIIVLGATQWKGRDLEQYYLVSRGVLVGSNIVWIFNGSTAKVGRKPCSFHSKREPDTKLELKERYASH